MQNYFIWAKSVCAKQLSVSQDSVYLLHTSLNVQPSHHLIPKFVRHKYTDYNTIGRIFEVSVRNIYPNLIQVSIRKQLKFGMDK